MGRYVLRRLLQFIPTMLGALFLLHYIVSLGVQFNGNPARAFFGDRTPSPAMLEAVKRVYNLEDPCLEQPGNPCLNLFVERIVSLAQGDLGANYQGRDVTDILAQTVPVTLRLTLIAILVQIGIGLTAGVIAGLRSGSLADYAVKVNTSLIVAIPTFVLGALVQVVIALQVTRWLRGADAPETLTSFFSVSYQSTAPWLSLIIPGFVLGALGTAQTARLTRTSLMENLRADYVRTAMAKGMPRARVVGVHALRNSLIPVVTDLGYSVGVLMGGAVITETIFNVPGVGGAMIRAIRSNEAPVIISIVTAFVLVYLIVNLIVDLLYAVLDPRIRYD